MPRFNFTFQETSPLISYTDGLWLEESPGEGENTVAHDSSMVTNSSSAKATFTFLGTGASMFGGLLENHSDFGVDLDNSSLLFTGDGDRVASGLDLWHAYNLDNKEHTVEITTQPTSSGQRFSLDYISIEREIGQESDSMFDSVIDDTAPNVRYLGAWNPGPTMQPQNHNGTIHTTTAAGSHLMITFHGCCIELYGMYANAAYTAGVDNQPPISVRGFDIDLPEDMWHPRTLLYLKDGLSEDRNHTVTLSMTETNQQRPLSFDYAVIRSTNNTMSAVFSHPDKSQVARVKLIVGLTSGCVLLALVFITYVLVRRRKLHAIAAEAEPHAYEINHDRMGLLANWTQSASSVPVLDSQPIGRHSSRPLVPQAGSVEDVVGPGLVSDVPPPAYDSAWSSGDGQRTERSVISIELDCTKTKDTQTTYLYIA